MSSVVCVCVSVPVVVLELTWIVVTRVLAPLPCKIQQLFVVVCLRTSVYCFPLATVLRLKLG